MNDKKNISAEEVKKLRDSTGVSVMDCRKALEKCEGNMRDALSYLQKTGFEKASKKTDRQTSEGVVASYIHGNKKVGSLLELLCETDFVARNSQFQELAHDLAMHIAAMNPQYLAFEKVPHEKVSEYEEIIKREMALEGKSPEIAKRAIDGKVKKHFDEISLMSQKFVKNPDITIEDLLKENIAKVGENIQVGDFARFEI